MQQHGNSQQKDTAPLLFAVKCGALDCIKLLLALRSSADISARTAKGDTVLMSSLAHGHIAAAEYLLTSGNACDSYLP
jgi:ankyrin repeat protein